MVRVITWGLHRLQHSLENYDIKFVVLSFDMFCSSNDKKQARADAPMDRSNCTIVMLPNPTGIPSISPRFRSYPGLSGQKIINHNPTFDRIHRIYRMPFPILPILFILSNVKGHG